MGNGVPKLPTSATAGEGGGGGAELTTTVSAPVIVSVVLPSGSVASAELWMVALPAPTEVIMAPFGVLGSGATVNTVGSELV